MPKDKKDTEYSIASILARGGKFRSPRHLSTTENLDDPRTETMIILLNYLKKHVFYNSLSEEKKSILEALLSTQIEISALGRAQSIHSSGCATPAFGRRLKTIFALRDLSLRIEIPIKPNYPDIGEEKKVRGTHIFQKINSKTTNNDPSDQFNVANKSGKLLGTIFYSYSQYREPVDSYDYTGKVHVRGCAKLQPLVEKSQEIFHAALEENDNIRRSKL